MPSSSGAEETLTSPIEQQADGHVEEGMDAKLMVATTSGDVQQLKDLVKKQESQMMVVVMAKQQAAPAEKHHQGNMDPRLLALASSGSYEELKSLLCREERQAYAEGVEEVADEGGSALVCASSSEKLQTILNEEETQTCVDGVEGSLPMQRTSDGIVEGNVSILEGITAEGHTASVCASSSEKTQTLANAEEGEVCADGTDGSLHMRQASDGIVEANESILEVVVAEGDTALGRASSFEKRQTLLNPEEEHACDNGTEDGSLHMRRACDDIEANELILEGVTAQGDTALHVVATRGQGDNFFTRFREAKHLLPVQQNNKLLTPAERHALTTYGDGDNFLESARIIYGKAKHLLFVQNKNGDTPLHCAARAGKPNMVKCLIHLARDEGGEGRMKELLRKQNKHKETALHEAIRVGNKDIVDLLMDKDPDLASFPQEGGTSPMYLAIELRQDEIVKRLFDKSSEGKLSSSGPNGQNALHAAIVQYRDLTKFLKWNKKHLRPQNKDLTIQRDENGSTPLHFAAAIKFPFGPSRVCRQVLKANPDALYQPDHAGFFPIHVAASVGASWNVDMFVTKYPASAGLCDAKGRTFLHIAVEKKEAYVIRSACRNLSLSWIMNMVDNDGNTALHLAVEAGSLRMFCPLLENPQVNLNLPNNNGETPLDIAEYKTPDDGLVYNQNSEEQILCTLGIAGGKKAVRRLDHLKDKKTLKAKRDESKQLEVLKDSTATMCIGSVLIATVTFGATFAVPGGYIADDHNNGGSPILARRYAFDAFIASNTLAFVFSAMATIGLMQSGSPLFNPRSRSMHLGTAFYLVSISITCLAAAFALGAYVVLAPVAHKTAVATCVLTSLVLLYKNVEFISRRLLLLPPLSTRKGLIWAWIFSAFVMLGNMLFENWPLIFIFGWAAHAKPADIQAPQAPAPLQA